MKLSKDHRSILAKIAHLLFPVEAWVHDKINTPTKPSPWRAKGAKPTVNDLDVVGFIEYLLSHELDDERVARRWKQDANDPLKCHDTLPGRSRWRRSRKGADGKPTLDSTAVFGAAASSNFVLTEERLENGQFQLSPLTRGKLYELCLDALARMTKERGLFQPLMKEPDLKQDSAWKAFLEELKNPATLTGWPPHTPSSLEFLRQLERDILYAAWTLRSPVAEDFREVMALETGEHRRPGNAYTLDAVKAAVGKLEKFFELKPLPIDHG